MNWVNEDSLNFLLMRIAMEELGVSEEAASRFARIATANVAGFFLRFENVPEHLLLRDVTLKNGRFIAEWESVSTHADCPECEKISEKQFSSYLRSEMIQDVGISGIPLWHRIWRKQYICTNDHCVRKRFFESFPGFIETRYSRMTVEFADRIIMVAKDTSDRAAAKILNDEGSQISKSSPETGTPPWHQQPKILERFQ